MNKKLRRSISYVLILIFLVSFLPAAMGASKAPADYDEILALPIAVFDVYGQNLDRGVLAAVVENGVYISWRYFPEEATGFDNDTNRLIGVDFDIFKNGVLLNETPLTTSTSYVDFDGTNDDEYVIVTVVGDVYVSRTEVFRPAPRLTAGFTDGRPGAERAGYLEFPVHMPPDSVQPHDQNPGQTSVWPYFVDKIMAGDLDGDGQIDLVVRLQGRNPDVTNPGYAPPVILQGYKLGFAGDGSLTGTILWEIDLGVNIRAGQHYSQPMLYNFDGGANAQLMVKTAPGTRWRSFEDGVYDDFNNASLWTYIEMPETVHTRWDGTKNWTHQDDYRANDLTTTAATREDGIVFQWMVDFFYNWQSHPEVTNAFYGPNLEFDHYEERGGFGWWKYPPQVMMGMYPSGYVGDFGAVAAGAQNNYSASATHPGWTLARWQLLNAIPKDPVAFKNHVITYEEALALAHLYYRWQAPSNQRFTSGIVIDGPEFFTVFDGKTGKDLDSMEYLIPRGFVNPNTGVYTPDIGIMWNDFTATPEPMNRVERHRGAVGYLDGVGKNASAIQGRGYYGSSSIMRYDWDGESISGKILIWSGFEVSGSPFHNGSNTNGGAVARGLTHGGPGRGEGPNTFNPNNPTVQVRNADGTFAGPILTEQGGRVITVMDVDGDGFDEIITGGYTLNHDGSIRHAAYFWSFNSGSTATVPGTPGSGSWSRMGHGNDTHVGYFHPDQAYPALWNNGIGNASHILQNVNTGEFIWIGSRPNATGTAWGANGQGFRGIVGKFTDEPGWQLFGNAGPTTATNSVTLEAVSGLPVWRRPDGDTTGGLRQWNGSQSAYQWTHTGTNSVTNPSPGPGTNWSIQFLPDLSRQTIAGTADGMADVQITRAIAAGANPGIRIQATDGKGGRFMDIVNTRDTIATGGTKGQVLSADILGDYREELIVGTSNAAGSKVRIYFSTEESTFRLATLMADRRYRVEVTRQHSCYGRPAYAGYYLGSDMNMEIYFESIKPKVDLSALSTLIELALDIDNPAVYSKASWEALQDALAAAIVVRDNDFSTQKAIDGAYDVLLAAIDSLAPPVLVSSVPTAWVKKLNGNMNELFITVTESFCNGTKKSFEAAIMIKNNAEGTYQVGPYKVFVDTKGNDQIRQIRIVG